MSSPTRQRQQVVEVNYCYLLGHTKHMEKVQYNYRMTLSYTYCSLTPRKEKEQEEAEKV
jgi:hypothetical protein